MREWKKISHTYSGPISSLTFAAAPKMNFISRWWIFNRKSLSTTLKFTSLQFFPWSLSLLLNSLTPYYSTQYFRGMAAYNTHSKYSRLRCLLPVKGLVFCFYFGRSGSILQFRKNIIKVGSKSWLLTCSCNITLSFCFEERELNFCNGYLSLLDFC